ncbi:MAG TPA: hypothetical protein GX697_03355 [Firmicutes bacterium]|nr:hypothetical protein [Bacillota bacterium]
MYQQQALVISLFLLGGYFIGQIGRKLNIPSIPAYIFAGVLMGPYVLNVISLELGNSLAAIKVLGISVIAFMVGMEIKIGNLITVWKKVLVISAFQICSVFLVVYLSFYALIRLSLPVSLLLAAIATTTAPCIIVIIKELKSRGILTSTLIEVVAFTDTLAIILFGVVSAVVLSLLKGGTIGFLSLFKPLIFEVGTSIGAGALTGIILTILLKEKRATGHVLSLLLSFVLLNSAAAYLLNFSPLLTNMISGFIIANIHPNPSNIFAVLDDIEMPVFILFYALAGATINLTTLMDHWNLVLVYIAARAAGLFIGSRTGTFIAKSEPNVRRYLWSATLTKGALGIGLAMLVQHQFAEIASLVVAIELSAVIILESLGPIFARFSLASAGEAQVS